MTFTIICLTFIIRFIVI